MLYLSLSRVVILTQRHIITYIGVMLQKLQRRKGNEEDDWKKFTPNTSYQRNVHRVKCTPTCTSLACQASI